MHTTQSSRAVPTRSTHGWSVPRYENAHRRGLLVQLPAGRSRTTRAIFFRISFSLPCSGSLFFYPPCYFLYIFSVYTPVQHAVQWCLPPPTTTPTHPTCPHDFPGPYARSLVCARPAKPAFPSLDPRPLTLRPSGTLDHASTRDPTPGGWPQRVPPKVCSDGEA